MELHPESPSGRRLHEIDGLRAVAIALVVFHHTLTSAVTEALRALGFEAVSPFVAAIPPSGVELFFVLSGIVLLRPYVRGERRFKLASYTRRRLRRLWPPYLAALALAGLVIYLVTVSPSWYSRQVLPSFNVFDWIRQAVLINAGWTIYNLAWWSLTPEVMFYLAAPVFAVLLARRSVRQGHVFACALGIALVSIAWWDPTRSGPGVQVGFDAVVQQIVGYSVCFAAGLVLAKYDFGKRSGILAVSLGSAYFIASVLHPPLNNHVAFALLYGGLVILALQPGGWLSRQLTRPGMVWLGERSYSLFLTHHSFVYAGNHTAALLFPSRDIAYFIVSRGLALPAAVLGAMGLFMLVERRFARGLVTAEAVWPWSPAASLRAENPSSAEISTRVAPAQP
jgi:peptidoglycan/LPS O-acetylase OafA/YrhL